MGVKEMCRRVSELMALISENVATVSKIVAMCLKDSSNTVVVYSSQRYWQQFVPFT